MLSFEQMCSSNYERIYKYIKCMIADHVQAQDITQEVFIIAWQKGNRFLNHDKPEAFLYKTAKNLVLKYCREEKKAKKIALAEQLSADDGDDVFDFLCREYSNAVQEEEYIPDVLSNLSPEKKQLYIDYYMKHKPMKVIAKEQNISPTALRMQYVRLRRELKDIIEQLQLDQM